VPLEDPPLLLDAPLLETPLLETPLVVPPLLVAPLETPPLVPPLVDPVDPELLTPELPALFPELEPPPSPVWFPAHASSLASFPPLVTPLEVSAPLSAFVLPSGIAPPHAATGPRTLAKVTATRPENLIQEPPSAASMAETSASDHGALDVDAPRRERTRCAYALFG
jgi:hypothetical protein